MPEAGIAAVGKQLCATEYCGMLLLIPAWDTGFWHESLPSRYDGIVIPDGVDLHVCVWGIMGYVAKLTHGGGPSFEVESQTHFRLFHACHTTFTSRSGTLQRMSNPVIILIFQ